ncbi:hypothetical protein C8R43DRAFT_944123 [Mycena crocata]|nr:hypothetical protein C8R43DRAFT_944123 [Mycena crocata]
MQILPKSMWKSLFLVRGSNTFGKIWRGVNAEREPGVRFRQMPNPEPERGVQFADADKGRVLPGFTTMVSSVLSAAIELLAEFDLCFTDVRLMQRATGTIIAGCAVTSLLPVQNDIDFFTRITCGLKIIRFLQMNNYSVDSTHYSYHDHVNVNVIECSSYYPFNTVVKFHSSPVFVGWTGKVIWFGYALMSAAGVAITSSSLTAFHGDLGHFQRIWYALNKYMRRGFTYYLEEYPELHVCGRDFNGSDPAYKQ